MTQKRPLAKKARAAAPKTEVSVRCFAMSCEVTGEDGSVQMAEMHVQGDVNMPPEAMAALIAIAQAAYRRLGR